MIRYQTDFLNQLGSGRRHSAFFFVWTNKHYPYFYLMVDIDSSYVNKQKHIQLED